MKYGGKKIVPRILKLFHQIFFYYCTIIIAIFNINIYQSIFINIYLKTIKQCDKRYVLLLKTINEVPNKKIINDIDVKYQKTKCDQKPTV